MPIQPNFLERTAFFTLNAAPAPMLDLAGMLAYQAVSTAVRLNIFQALAERPSTDSDPQLAYSFQQRMVGNAYAVGAALLKKLPVLAGAMQVLDVGGGHGVVSIVLAEAHPQLQWRWGAGLTRGSLVMVSFAPFLP